MTMATDIQLVEQPTIPAKPLTRRQKVFVSEYIQSWNAADAARKAGYSVRSAYSIGWELLRKPEVKAAIEARLDEVQMGADEALKLTADIARGDIGEFMAIGPMGFSLDLEAAQKAGKTNLLKKVTQKTVIDGKRDTETHIVDIELYDRQAALRDILGVHGRLRGKGTSERENGSDSVISAPPAALLALAAQLEAEIAARVERARAVDGAIAADVPQEGQTE
jgi:phage terminase small subunit